MEDLLKNKLFIIFSLFIILTFFIFNCCFSSSEKIIDFTSSELNRTFSVTLPSGYGVDYSYFVIGFQPYYSDYSHSYCYRLVMAISNCPLYYDGSYWRPKDESSLGYYNTFHSKDYSSFSKFPSSLDFSAYSISDFKSSVGFGVTGLDINDLVYSNYTIYNDASDSKVVFQGAPQEVEQITIPAITQAEEIPQVMSKVLTMIIPIGLIVFSSGLLIYLVRLVILRMT